MDGTRGVMGEGVGGETGEGTVMGGERAQWECNGTHRGMDDNEATGGAAVRAQVGWGPSSATRPSARARSRSEKGRRGREYSAGAAGEDAPLSPPADPTASRAADATAPATTTTTTAPCGCRSNGGPRSGPARQVPAGRGGPAARAGVASPCAAGRVEGGVPTSTSGHRQSQSHRGWPDTKPPKNRN